MSNIVWIFDVDGVLCDTSEQITDEFKVWFIAWAQTKQFVLVTGSHREKTIQQIGPEIVDMAMMSFNCLGNSIWTAGEETLVNQIMLREDETRWLEDVVASSNCPSKTGNHVELRNGSINFSTVGRNASIEQRMQYKQWELTSNERHDIAFKFVKKFTRFEAYIGGDISIDLCLKGANKSQCIDFLPPHLLSSNIYFFGDKCGQGGIDEPLATRILARSLLGDQVHHVTGYRDTWVRLEQSAHPS